MKSIDYKKIYQEKIIVKIIPILFVINIGCNKNYYLELNKKGESKFNNVVYIHGYAGNNLDLEKYEFRLNSELKDYNFYTLNSLKKTEGGKNYSWFNFDFSSLEYGEKNGDKFLKKLNSELKRIKGKKILIGESQGGIVAGALGLKFPNRYKKVILINSIFDKKLSNEKNINTRKNKEIEFVFISSKYDIIFPIEKVEENIKWIQKKGFKIKIYKHNGYHFGISKKEEQLIIEEILK